MGLAWQVYEPGLWKDLVSAEIEENGEESFNTLLLPVKDSRARFFSSFGEVHSLGRDETFIRISRFLGLLGNSPFCLRLSHPKALFHASALMDVKFLNTFIDGSFLD